MNGFRVLVAEDHLELRGAVVGMRRHSARVDWIVSRFVWDRRHLHALTDRRVCPGVLRLTRMRGKIGFV